MTDHEQARPNPAPFDVSVVIPLYNKARFIRGTLLSALQQTHAATEIIVIDDGSTDGSADHIADLTTGRVRLVRQPNAGPGPARNRGIEQARSAWIAFLDGDDLWLPEHLQTLGELAAAFPQAGVLATGYEEVIEPAAPHSPFPATGSGAEQDYFAIPPDQKGVYSSAVAVRKTVLTDCGGFGSFWPAEDVEMWIRLAFDHRLAITDKVTARYVRNTGGLMDQLDRAAISPEQFEPIFSALDAGLADSRHHSRHATIARYRDQWLLIAARQAVLKGNPRLARSFLRRLSDKTAGPAVLLAMLSLLPPAFVRRGAKARSAIGSVFRQLYLRSPK